MGWIVFNLGMRSAVRLFFARLLICVAGILLSTAPARAELVQDGGAWLAFFGQGSFKELSPDTARLRWWFDGQARFSGEADGLSQTIVRPGVGWSITPRVSVWLGYGWIRDYPPSAPTLDENRIWQQLLWAPRFGELRFQSRTRLEQRFREGGDDVGWRLREFVKVVYPILSSERLFLAAYEEVFLNLNDTDWGPQAGFDQNRVFLGLQASITESVQIELGYLNRYVYRPGRDGLMDHLASVNVFFNPG